MDFIQKINDLRAQKADLLAKAETFAQEGNTEEINKISDQMKGINASIASYEALAEESRRNANPIDPSDPKDETGVTPKDERKAPCPFTSLGEQLQAIYKQQSQGIQDKRLAIVQDAAKGANEGVGSEGGFAVQEDFAGQILASAVQNSPLLQRLDSYTVGAASNSARWLQVDETDVSKSVFGGIQMYWVSEAHTVASSKPKFREVRMDLEKMMGLAYATDELLQDAPFMTGFFGNAFSLAADRLMTEGVISGDGAGKMTGILKSDALITVAKTTGQTAGTFTPAITPSRCWRGPCPGTGTGWCGSCTPIWRNSSPTCPSPAAARPSSSGTPKAAWATLTRSGCSTSRCCLRIAAAPWARRAISC